MVSATTENNRLPYKERSSLFRFHISVANILQSPVVNHGPVNILIIYDHVLVASLCTDLIIITSGQCL